MIDMKLWIKIIMSIYFSFMVFTWSSYFFGPEGFLETRTLTVYREKIRENTTNMEIINKKLEGMVRNLQNNPDLIALEARNLGYYRKNEGVFLLDGTPVKNQGYPLGSLYKEFPKHHSSIAFLRSISLFSGLLFFLLLITLKRKTNAYSAGRRYSEV